MLPATARSAEQLRHTSFVALLFVSHSAHDHAARLIRLAPLLAAAQPRFF